MTHKHRKFNFNNTLKDLANDVSKVEKPIAGIINNEINTTGKVLNEGLHSIGNVGSSLTIPLLIVGGIAVVYIMNK